MEFVIIGSGSGALQAHRGPSGYVLNLKDETFLLDGGTGTVKKCLEADISYKEIDKIFYTHLHPDHTIDLVPFLFATKHTPDFIRTKPLEIYGPVGFRDFYEKFTSLYGTGITDVDYDITVRELDDIRKTFDNWSLETGLMRHAHNAIGYRFESEGKALVYSGDTDYCEGIVRLAQNADVLILECSFPDDMKVGGHLTPSEAGRIATEANV
ncbi:ribonuclease Z, partial [candidate division KSB1 bacterium]|nr:ribonuclease Z [candidate division KSB1 bacterium]NIR71822.1 ribonuclease Z [candidate division KSB1 bacterium]NIS25338.1 ribonuclease Z [candidate division KSB1 bacterium]NIT71808.1 ribonuclease Z [candidate division KSB1 bacterium]NIU25546.1 ribonuclease Z [candidate division KSB1 bacterium]